jgi:lipopolysaccharide/colanic/teichoic acid biosynthesis glycosyltransferase
VTAHSPPHRIPAGSRGIARLESPGQARAGDVVLTFFGLVVIAPFLFVIAAVIKLQDGGPVIFRQTRVGRGSELFTLLKFRSMVIDVEGRRVDFAGAEQKATVPCSVA